MTQCGPCPRAFFELLETSTLHYLDVVSIIYTLHVTPLGFHRQHRHQWTAIIAGYLSVTKLYNLQAYWSEAHGSISMSDRGRRHHETLHPRPASSHRLGHRNTRPHTPA